MLKGALSNQPQAIVGIDYRILLDISKSYKWFVRYLPELLLNSCFEHIMGNHVALKAGAIDWLYSNWEHRFVVLSVGRDLLAPTIDRVLADYIPESRHFGSIAEFRHWILITTRIYRIYTNDLRLVGLDDLIRTHSGWSEKI